MTDDDRPVDRAVRARLEPAEAGVVADPTRPDGGDGLALTAAAHEGGLGAVLEDGEPRLEGR